MSHSLYARLARRFGPTPDPLSRRELLRTSALLGASLLLSGPTAIARARAAFGAKRVIVVGGGFSGLACAHELRSAGYDVTVVEAGSRVGGRVLSFSDLVPGKNVEGGAELIGSNHPTWVAYAEKFKLDFLDVTEAEDAEFPVILDGQRLSDADALKVWEEMDAAFSTMNRDAEPVDADQPWLSPKAAELDKRTTADWLKAQENLSPMTRRGAWALLTADNGVALERQSYLGMLAQIKGGGVEKYWTESEVYRCKGGNDQLGKKLAEAIGGDRIVLRLPVTAIKVSNNGVVATCTDGRTLEADDIVLAVPPSVWGKIEISPALPPALAPQLGVTLKYLVALKKRFWKEAKLAPDGLTDGPVSETWDGTDNQEGDEGAALNCFSGGPPAEQCREFSRDKRDERYLAELEQLFPGIREQFVQARFMDWPGAPWIMCGYSFPAAGQVTTVGPLLRKGMGRLHFAGEHACYQFVGYMEGALHSGAALAKRIAQRDGLTAAP